MCGCSCISGDAQKWCYGRKISKKKGDLSSVHHLQRSTIRPSLFWSRFGSAQIGVHRGIDNDLFIGARLQNYVSAIAVDDGGIHICSLVSCEFTEDVTADAAITERMLVPLHLAGLNSRVGPGPLLSITPCGFHFCRWLWYLHHQ